MELPIIIEPLPEQRGYVAHLGAHFNLRTEAATADEAYQQLAAQLQLRMQQGLQLRPLRIPSLHQPAAEPGWLADDELTHDWLQLMEEYRAECDAADRERLST